MKIKFALALSLSVASLAGAFASTKAYADVYPDPSCMRACRQEFQLCMTYTPDKAALCEAHRRQCQISCGSNL